MLRKSKQEKKSEQETQDILDNPGNQEKLDKSERAKKQDIEENREYSVPQQSFILEAQKSVQNYPTISPYYFQTPPQTLPVSPWSEIFPYSQTPAISPCRPPVSPSDINTANPESQQHNKQIENETISNNEFELQDQVPENLSSVKTFTNDLTSTFVNNQPSPSFLEENIFSDLDSDITYDFLHSHVYSLHSEATQSKQPLAEDCKPQLQSNISNRSLTIAKHLGKPQSQLTPNKPTTLKNQLSKQNVQPHLQVQGTQQRSIANQPPSLKLSSITSKKLIEDDLIQHDSVTQPKEQLAEDNKTQPQSNFSNRASTIAKSLGNQQPKQTPDKQKTVNNQLSNQNVLVKQQLPPRPPRRPQGSQMRRPDQRSATYQPWLNISSIPSNKSVEKESTGSVENKDNEATSLSVPDTTNNKEHAPTFDINKNEKSKPQSILSSTTSKTNPETNSNTTNTQDTDKNTDKKDQTIITYQNLTVTFKLPSKSDIVEKKSSSSSTINNMDTNSNLNTPSITNNSKPNEANPTNQNLRVTFKLSGISNNTVDKNSSIISKNTSSNSNNTTSITNSNNTKKETLQEEVITESKNNNESKPTRSSDDSRRSAVKNNDETYSRKRKEDFPSEQKTKRSRIEPRENDRDRDLSYKKTDSNKNYNSTSSQQSYRDLEDKRRHPDKKYSLKSSQESYRDREESYRDRDLEDKRKTSSSIISKNNTTSNSNNTTSITNSSNTKKEAAREVVITESKNNNESKLTRSSDDSRRSAVKNIDQTHSRKRKEDFPSEQKTKRSRIEPHENDRDRDLENKKRDTDKKYNPTSSQQSYRDRDLADKRRDTDKNDKKYSPKSSQQSYRDRDLEDKRRDTYKKSNQYQSNFFGATVRENDRKFAELAKSKKYSPDDYAKLGTISPDEDNIFSIDYGADEANKFLEYFWSNTKRTELIQNDHQRKYNRDNRRQILPGCISFLFFEINDEKYCLVTNSKQSEIIEGKVKDAINQYNSDEKPAIKFLYVPNINTNSFQELLKKLSHSASGRICSEKIYIRMLAELFSEYGEKMKVLSALTYIFYPYPNNKSIDKRFASMKRTELNKDFLAYNRNCCEECSKLKNTMLTLLKTAQDTQSNGPNMFPIHPSLKDAIAAKYESDKSYKKK